MYIEQLYLEDVKCFGKLHLDLRGRGRRPRRLTVLLGENGVGKTTLLQSIALCMAGARSGSQLVSSAMGWHKLVRLNAERAILGIALCPTGRDRAAGTAGRAQLAYEMRWREETFTPVTDTPLPFGIGGGAFEGPDGGNEEERFTCGYGPARRLGSYSTT